MILPGLALSLCLHMLLAFVPEKVVELVFHTEKQPSPVTRFQVVPLPSPEPVPVYQDKRPPELPYDTDIAPAPPQPQPRLTGPGGDSTSWIEIFAVDLADLTPAELPELSSSSPESWEADSAVSVSSYISEVFARISQAKQYPEVSRRLGHEGQVVVGFAIKRDGGLDSGTLVVNPSPYSMLNRAACQSILRSAPFPPLPGCIRCELLKLKVRILYELKE